MRQPTILDEFPFDTLVDYFNFGGPHNPQRSVSRVRDLLANGQIYNDPHEGLIVTVERYLDRAVTLGE